MKLVKITINQVSFKLLLTFAYQISTLISIPILANSISSIEFGKIAICLILLQISWTISEWGIPNYSIELAFGLVFSMSEGSKCFLFEVPKTKLIVSKASRQLVTSAFSE